MASGVEATSCGLHEALLPAFSLLNSLGIQLFELKVIQTAYLRQDLLELSSRHGSWHTWCSNPRRACRCQPGTLRNSEMMMGIMNPKGPSSPYVWLFVPKKAPKSHDKEYSDP